MSSAAKLRKYGRGTATVAAAALVVTSFGPTAFAYRAPTPPPTASNQAGAASLGITDTDPATDGTQGATAVTPGGSGQSTAQMKFVLPSTWQTGDSIDFTVSRGATGLPAADPATTAARVSYSSKPSVAISSTAYAETTHVADTSPTTNRRAGATEGGTLAPYTPTGNETPAKAPQFETQVLSAGTNNYENVLRVTFTNDSDAAAARAKFIGTIDAKLDVGTGVTGAIPVIATGVDNLTAGDGGVLTFFGDADSPRNVTYPAAVLPASLDVRNGSVVADGSNQSVGPLTVTAASGSNFTDGQDVAIELGGATFTGDPVTVNAYNSAGTLLATGRTTQSAGGATLTFAVPTGPGDVARVVFTDPVITAPTSGTRLTYSLSSLGGLVAVNGPLGGAAAPTHQIDIAAPSSVSDSQPVASDLPDRIGGQDRYQTAVKIAERALGTNTAGVRGESDNVVIASGEGFADALSAGYLAATKKAQLILTRAGSLPQTDVEFLRTYGAKNVYIVGGNGSVSRTVEDQLRGMQSYDVQAAEGATRPTTVAGATTYNVATSNEGGAVTAVTDATGLTDRAAVRDTGNSVTFTRDGAGAIQNPQVNGTSAGVTVTTAGSTTVPGEITWTTGGQNFTIAIAGSAATGGTFDATVTPVAGQPTTGTEPIPAEEATGSNRKVVPLSANLTVTRLAGSDRFETNRKVNEYAGATSANPVGSMSPEYGKARAKTALVTNGLAPWDALAAGPLVGNSMGSATQFPIPMILTGSGSLNANAKAQIQSLDIGNAIFVGGPGVLPDSAMGEGDDLGAYTSRIYGADRWGTAKAIADFALKDAAGSTTNRFPGLGFGANRPILANGGSMNGSFSTAQAKGAWADALAAGPWAAAESRIIALTDSRSLPGTTADLFKTHADDLTAPVVAVGLGDVVSTETVEEANRALQR